MPSINGNKKKYAPKYTTCVDLLKSQNAFNNPSKWELNQNQVKENDLLINKFCKQNMTSYKICYNKNMTSYKIYYNKNMISYKDTAIRALLLTGMLH